MAAIRAGAMTALRPMPTSAATRAGTELPHERSGHEHHQTCKSSTLAASASAGCVADRPVSSDLRIVAHARPDYAEEPISENAIRTESSGDR